MSIVGIGIDIVEIARVKKSLDKFGNEFAKKILHANEYKIYSNHKIKERYLAKRFAAKEAFAKALGSGIVAGVTLPKIEVVNDLNGKPELRLHGSVKNKMKTLEVKNDFLTISDEKNYAVAQVILES